MIGGKIPASHSVEAGGQDWRQEDSYEAVAIKCLQKETQKSREGNWVAKGQRQKKHFIAW